MRLIGPLHSTEENYKSRVHSIYSRIKYTSSNFTEKTYKDLAELGCLLANIVFNFKYLLEKILRWKLYPHVIASIEGTTEKKHKAGRCWQKVNEIQKFTLFIRI